MSRRRARRIAGLLSTVPAVGTDRCGLNGDRRCWSEKEEDFPAIPEGYGRRGAMYGLSALARVRYYLVAAAPLSDGIGCDACC